MNGVRMILNLRAEKHVLGVSLFQPICVGLGRVFAYFSCLQWGLLDICRHTHVLLSLHLHNIFEINERRRLTA